MTQINNLSNDLSKSLAEMRRMSDEMRVEVDKLNRLVGWSEWEPHTVGIIPKRINGRWYFKGDRVYRKEKMWGLSGSNRYKYGDEFDILRDA